MFCFYCPKLSVIGDNAFNRTRTWLIRMSFEGNNLTALPKSLEQVGDNLKYISFQRGRISDISVLPGNLMGLHYLKLTDNQISDVDMLEKALEGRDKLEELRVDFNLLNRMPNISALPELDDVNVDNNNITDIPEGTFNIKVIRHLRACNNKLTVIPKDLESASRMFRIYLSGNKIRSFDNFEFTTGLRYLHLDNNDINEINFMRFTGGHSSSQLKWVQMFNNPIRYIRDGAFEKAHGIRQLTLSNTLLTRLPMAIKDIPQLTMLYLNGVTNLTCSCDEAALGAYYHKRGPSGMNIGGECTSGVTITYFLHELAGQCPGA